MSMQDLFAEAVERLIAGEAPAAIVASYPAEVQDEIRSLLAVIELADHMAVQPAPVRGPAQRQRARADFLQQAHTLRAEMEQALDTAEQAGTTASQTGAAPARARTRTRLAGWGEQLRSGWRNFLDAPVLRLAPLAPLAAVILAVYLATFWTVQSAQAALPGDAVYPLKQWVRQQRITLAPPEQRPGAVRAAEEEIAAEARTLSTRTDARAGLAAEYNELLIYYGRQGNLLLFGPFLVAPNFQPDPNEETFVAMHIDGDLEPGARVELAYRLLPGNPNVVQGVSASVIEAPKPTPPPTAAPTPQPSCQRQLPTGWMPYAVHAGDSLESLAARSGANVATIMRVNCLEDGLPDGVSTVYLPDSIIVRVTPPAMPSPLPTYTPWPTATAEPTATEVLPTGTPEPPTAQPTSTSTPEEGDPAGTVTPIITPDVTPDVTPGTTPTGDATPADPTAEPTGDATVEPTSEPTGEPTTEPTGEATVEPTGAPTIQPTVEPTSELTVEPTGAVTPEPTTEPTGSAATVTPDATPPATEPPATEPPATEPPATATLEVTAATTEVDQPTPEPPTPNPPTPEPPTREAPTRAPEPTQVSEPTPAPPEPPTAEPESPTPVPPAETTDNGGQTAA